MKNLILLLIISFTLSCCEKDNTSKPVAEIDKLPPATQIGANTVGCLLDGKAFKPGSYNNSTNCFYQYVNGEYYFYLNFNNKFTGVLRSISVGTEGLQIEENQTLDLLERTKGNAFGIWIDYVTPNYTTHTHRRIENHEIGSCQWDRFRHFLV
ncbi:MAG: hypothetical protein ACI7YS_12040 [Flavobacterium sp.]